MLTDTKLLFERYRLGLHCQVLPAHQPQTHLLFARRFASTMAGFISCNETQYSEQTTSLNPLRAGVKTCFFCILQVLHDIIT